MEKRGGVYNIEGLVQQSFYHVRYVREVGSITVLYIELSCGGEGRSLLYRGSGPAELLPCEVRERGWVYYSTVYGVLLWMRGVVYYVEGLIEMSFLPCNVDGG